MRTVCFVTNRPPITGGFGPPPPVGAAETLSFGTVVVEPSAVPWVGGRVVGPVQCTGAVACSVPGPDKALVTALLGWLAQAAQVGAVPIVLVHGFSYGFADAVVRAGDLCAWWEAAGTGATNAGGLWPIAFTWPSIDGLSPANYLDDRARAQASAQAFARFMLAFVRAWEQARQPRCHFLTHSMGAWMTQNGLRALAAMPDTDLPSPLFEQAMVMAGDADPTALEPGEGLDQLARLSRWLTIGVNRTDFATGVASADILKRPRLGSSGPATLSRLPGNARIVDYTLAVAGDRQTTPPGETDWNFKLHQYYRTNLAVRGDIAAMLVGGVPERIAGRFSSGQMIKAGQVGIRPGRLYVCPAPESAAPPDQDNPERRG